MDEKKYPVFYYDAENMDLEILVKIAKQLQVLYEEEGFHCIFLPLTMKLEWLPKEILLQQLKEHIKEVESWE